MSTTTDAKPTARELGWQVLETRRPYEGKLFTLRADRLRLPEGSAAAYEYEERTAAVIVVPVTKRGEIVLLRQYRYPVDAWCWEVPAGTCRDTGDLPLEEVARKELREEVGAEVERLEHVGEFFSAPSFADEVCHVFLAWGAELSRKPEQEKAEEIHTQVVPAGEALRRAKSGEMKNAACALAVCWCEERLRAGGYI